MVDDIVERWMKLELGKVHQQLVPSPMPLETLLDMDDPVAQTRSGDAHEFDVDALQGFAEPLSDDLRGRVKLPIHVYLDREVQGNVYVKDDASIAALRQLGEVDREPRDGKLWLSKPLAVDLMERYPSLLQFVFH